MPQDDKTRAEALLDKHDGYFSTLDVDGLCDELSRLVMQWTLTAYQVFEVMSQRGYSQSALESVATNLTNRINEANLVELAKSPHGSILLARIQYLMNCPANGNQPVCQRTAEAFARANGSGETKIVAQPNDSEQPRQLSEEEMNYYADYNASPLALKSGPRKKFNPDICWQLPNGGTGFVIYSPDDLIVTYKKTNRKKYNDKYGYDQIGTKETVNAMIHIAREWSADSTNLNRKIQYGDISRPGGINTPDHGEHNTGKAFDIRLLRKDDLLEGLTWGQTAVYSRELTKKFILLAVRLYPGTTVYFNDKALYQEDAHTKNIVDPSPKHDDHLHVMFPGGKE